MLKNLSKTNSPVIGSIVPTGTIALTSVAVKLSNAITPTMGTGNPEVKLITTISPEMFANVEPLIVIVALIGATVSSLSFPISSNWSWFNVPEPKNRVSSKVPLSRFVPVDVPPIVNGKLLRIEPDKVSVIIVELVSPSTFHDTPLAD